MMVVRRSVHEEHPTPPGLCVWTGNNNCDEPLKVTPRSSDTFPVQCRRIIKGGITITETSVLRCYNPTHTGPEFFV